MRIMVSPASAQPRVKNSPTPREGLRAKARMRSTVSRSPLPQYWAARMVVPMVSTIMKRLNTKLICPASDTAESASCSTKPSITASEAFTAADMKF